MSERSTANLAKILPQEEDHKASEQPVEENHSKVSALEVQHILLHYPEPTPLSRVLQDVAKWAELSFVMDPRLNRPMQIFSPRRLHRDEAFQVFLASLETIGLRALQLQGGVVKVVPVNSARIV